MWSTVIFSVLLLFLISGKSSSLFDNLWKITGTLQLSIKYWK